MKIRKSYFFPITIVLTFIAVIGSSQQQQKIIPVTPEAAALSKMVNYEVSMNTGVPDISIPFYEIKSGGLTLPIAINYHGGGFKINEQATSIGLGWSLSCDLQITRTVNGTDDLNPGTQGYIFNNDIKAVITSNPGVGYYTFDNYTRPLWLAQGTLDGMPDKFTYKLLNKSGSFYFQKTVSGTSYVIVPVPFDHIRIAYNNGQFIITDTDGTVYYFGTPGPMGDINNNAANGFEVSGNIDPLGQNCMNCVKSAWKCKRIDNPTRTDSILFEYAAKNVSSFKSYREYVEYFNDPLPCLSGQTGSKYVTGNDSRVTGSLENVLSQLSFHDLSSPKYIEHFGLTRSYFHIPYLDAQQNVVDKKLDAGSGVGNSTSIAGLRLARITFRGGAVQFVGAEKMTDIKVYDSKNTEVKAFSFFQSYTNAIYPETARNYNGVSFEGTRYLDSVHMTGGGIAFEKYAFMYKNKYCFGNHLVGSDAWGYVNAKTMEIGAMVNQPSLPINVPKQTKKERFFGSIADACWGMSDSVNISFGGGSYTEDPDEELMQRGILKRIVYPTGGYVDFDFETNKYEVAFSDHFGMHKMPVQAGGLRIQMINYFNGNSLQPVSQKYYRYGELEDGVGLVKNKPPGKFVNSVYEHDAYSFTQYIHYVNGINEGVSCFDKNCLEIRGKEIKTTYMPASSLDLTYANGAPIYYTKVSEYQKDFGANSGKTVFKYYSPDAFNLGGQVFGENNFIPGTNVPFLQANWNLGALKSKAEYKFENGRFQLLHRKSHEYSVYRRTEEIRVIYSYLNNIYQKLQNFTGSEQQIYDPSVSFHESNGALTTADFIPGNYSIPMGKLRPLRDVEEWVSNTQTLTQEVQYYYDNIDYVQPSRIKTTNSKGEINTKWLKHAYDYTGINVYDQMNNNNMVSQVVEEWEENNTLGKEISRSKMNYAIWDKTIDFIAPATVQKSFKGGTLQTDISFELYDDNANILQLTASDSITKSYIWGYDRNYPVAEVTGMKYPAAIALVNQSVLENPADDNQLRTAFDNLYTAGPGVLVNTYTYKRLTGITSQKTPNKRISYFEYDGYGRLQHIKDHDLKIIKKYEYNMVGTATPNAANAYYVNKPFMKTLNAFCNPSERSSYNQVVYGGNYASFSPSAANYAAELGVGAGIMMPIADGTCPTPLAQAAMTLYSSFSVTAPGAVSFSFIQDESIVAMQNYGSGSTTFYLPVGQYKVSLASDPNYKGRMIKYYFTGSNGTNFYISSGDAITLAPGVTYSIGMVNSL